MFVISALNPNVVAADKINNELDISIKTDLILAGISLVVDIEDELTNKQALLEMTDLLISTEQLKFDNIPTKSVSSTSTTKIAE